MGRPAGISRTVESILAKEAARLEKKSTDVGLDDLELARMQKLLAISQQLVNPAHASMVEPEDLDEMVAELTPKRRDRTLFPKPGPKSTAAIHEPDE